VSDEARLDRHYELWKQESTSVGRWVFGVSLFAAMVLLRVIEPYIETSHSLTRDRAQLEVHTAVQSDEKGKLEETERLEARVGKLYEDISRSPWQQSVEELKRGLERLGEAYRLLADKAPAELGELLSRSPEPTALEDDVSQLAPSTERRRADSRRRGGRRSDPLDSRPLTVSSAAELLALDAGAIDDVSSAEFSLLLERRVREVAQERAGATINEIARLVEDTVVAPLERLVGDSGQTQLRQELAPVVGKLKVDMEDWNRALLADSQWYRTVARKDSVVSGLVEQLDAYRRDFTRVATAERERLNESIGARRQVLREIRTEIKGLEETTEHLGEVLDTALPGWIRGLVSPEQMIQLYPPALLLLAGVLTFKTCTTRRHFVSVRDHLYADGAHRRDGALSSTWTLVYRGAIGTCVTAVAFVGCAALLLWLFDRGTDAALTWLANRPDAGWAGTGSWLERLRPAGWAWFVGVASASVLALVLDGRPHTRSGGMPS
jgi:hypothetical protein